MACKVKNIATGEVFDKDEIESHIRAFISSKKSTTISAMEDIDPTKQYTYEKDGKPVTTNGAALITHLETGDIYEKEKPDDKVSKTEKAPDTKGEDKEPAPDQAQPSVEVKPEGEIAEEKGEYKPNIRDDYFAKADFFTPEEKEKFQTLDDAGKDKMIDDKRAELKEKSTNLDKNITNVVSNRLSPEEKSGAVAGGQRNVEATNVVESIHRASAKGEGIDQGLSQEEIREKESKALEQYAKDNGIWVEDPFTEFGNKPDAHGAEQNVYLNKDGATVTKINSGSVHGDWREFFERIAVHNQLFPDTKYTLKGFTNLSGDLSAILEQPLIKAERGATKEEIESDMAKSGFANIEGNDYFNEKTGVFVRDLHGENVLMGKDGKLFYIDPIIELDTPDKGYGGTRKDIQPELNKSDKTQVSDNDHPNEAAKTLQGSYDRLILSGADLSDPEMKRLQSKIEKLSSLKTQEDANVETQQSGGSQKEGDAEESGQESQQKTDEKGNVLTPEADQGAGEPPTGEPAPASAESKSPIVGIRDSIVNSDRVHRGLEPLVKEFTRHWQDNWNQIKANIRKGFSPRKFIEETAQRIAREDNKKLKGEKPRHRTTFSDYDYAALLFDRLDISNNIAHAHDVLEEAKAKGDLGAETAAQQIIDNYNLQLDQNDTVGRRMKSESGRSLSAIQMMTKMDGELVPWTRDIENKYHGTMPEVLRKFVNRIETEYKAKAEELLLHQEEQLKKAAEDAFKKGKEEGLKEKKTSKPDKSVKAQGKELADKVRALREKFGTNKRDNLQSNIFGLPIAVIDGALVTIANLVEGGAKLIDAINEALKDVDFRSDKDREAFIASLQNAEDPNSEQAKRARYLEDIQSVAKENDATNLIPDAVKSVKKLMTSYVKDESVQTLDQLVEKTNADLRDVLPDVTEKELRDAFSGYGMKSDTEARVKSDLAKMREQARKVSEYQDLLKPVPGESLSQEMKRLEKAAKLHDEVDGYMREMGIEETPPPTTPEGQKAVALDKAKSRMKSIIKSLDKQILSGERKKRNGVTPDAELTVLKAERARLSAQLTEISKARISPEQKIKMTEDALNRQILNYERQIREGVDPMKPREERPTTKQIEQLRQRKNALKKEVEGLHREIDPKTDQQKRALDDYNEGLEKKIAELQAKLESGNLDKESPPAKTDFSRDPKSLALEKSLKKLEGDFHAARKAGELINRSWLQKAMSLAATVKRAFVLSRISTFGRLLSADVWSNLVFAPSETVAGAAGYIGTKVGFAKKLSQQADRYGAPLSLKDFATLGKAEAAAVKALGNPQTWKDFVTDVKSGYNELSLMYGDTHTNVPKELRDHWQTIEHGLEAISRSHGAVKGISKRMEFARSYVIRKESARRKGADVDNPVVQASIGAMAYQDAARHVLMEDNKASKGYQKIIAWLQKPREANESAEAELARNILALGMNELMPIVKIPTNMMLNAARATLGTPLAGSVILARGIAEVMSKGNSEWGISKLTPEQSDALLRNFRKGNVGMGLMLAGFFAPGMFGAAHYYQKGSDQPEGLEEGEVKFFGVTVPKWLADNPYLATMNIGASLRASFDYYTDEKSQSFVQAATSSLLHTAAGAAEETPLIGAPAQLYQAATGYGGNWFWYNMIKSTVEPGILQEIAEDTDVKDGWFSLYQGDRIKRKPQSIGEALETGIPGMRENVEQK